MEETSGLTPDTGRSTPVSEGGADIRKTNRLLLVLYAGLVLLLIAGIALLGAYFLMLRQPATAGAGGSRAATTGVVAPDLAVLSLAGEPDDRVVRAALDANELETARATLASSTLLSDGVRSGHWLLLAERYARLGGGDARPGSDQAYLAILDQASLAPGLSDATRAELSMQAAHGLAALKKPAIARLAMAQAETVARSSVELLPTQRREILNKVVNGYSGLGDTQAATTLRSQMATASMGPGTKPSASIDILGQMRGSVVLPTRVVPAIQARQAAAAALAARWLTADSAGRLALATGLGDALRAEDGARSDFYAGLSTLSEANQLSMQHDRVAWLTIKYRVARGGYGTTLVPEWEGQASQIGADLAAAYTDLINTYGRRLATLEPGMADQGRMQLLQQGLLWVRLGLFPDHVEASLSKQLIDVSQQVWTRRGSAGLVVVAQDVEGRRYYLLAGSNPAK